MPQQQTLPQKQITWSAKEYHTHKKSTDWFWALGVLAILGAITAILFNNVLLALLILLSSFIVAIYATKESPESTFTISQRGIQIDDTLFPFRNLSSFWISADIPEEEPKLLVRSQNMLTPLLVIPLAGIDTNELHSLLLRNLPEHEQNEPVSYRIVERLGF